MNACGENHIWDIVKTFNKKHFFPLRNGFTTFFFNFLVIFKTYNLRIAGITEKEAIAILSMPVCRSVNEIS